MTTMIPDSWEHLAGSVHDMSGYRRRPQVGQPRGDAKILDFQRPEKVPPPEDYSSPWEEHWPIYDPADDRDPADLYESRQLDALAQAGFEPHKDAGVWKRDIRDAEGNLTATDPHLIYHYPGAQDEGGSLKPWHFSADEYAAPSAHATLGEALRAADAHRDKIRKMTFVFPHWTKVAVEKTPAQIAAEKWLEENSDQFDHWEPQSSDYTHQGFGDPAGQSFHGEEEATSHTLPDWHARDHQTSEPAWQGGDDDDSGDPPQHEQDLADLGFNWQHRGHPEVTPVGEYQEGEYVRHQYTPEGRHVATHRIYRDPNGRSDTAWHAEHESADTPGFVESHTTHRFPHDAISRYYSNAEQALLPSRGYEPHHGSSGVVSHWTRTDTSTAGDVTHHEISNQPSGGDGYLQGWEGLSHGDHFNRSYAREGTTRTHQHDLADVVREQDEIGRGLHPGGAQDYRVTRDQLLSDPSVKRLGAPHWVSDNFYNDGKVGKALWVLPHPNPPRQTVFDPTAPGYSREVEPENSGINVEATYNWDKGGYDFNYTHNGERLWPHHEHFPAGAPVHVPGRQTRLPLGH